MMKKNNTMKSTIIGALWIVFCCLPTLAQTSSTRFALETQNNANIVTNGTGKITGPVLNSMLGNMITSTGTLLDNNTWVGSQTFSYFSVPLGTLQHDYDTYAPITGYIAQGSSGSPITTNGGTFSITRYQQMPAGACAGNLNDTECDAALNVIVRGGASDNMVLSGINVSAISSSTVAGANVQALNCHGDATGSSPNIAGCGYMEGRRETSTAFAQGIEITAWNATNVPCYVGYGTAGVAGGLGFCDGIWLSARGNSQSYPESSALHIGLGNNTGQWQEGVTVNKGAVATAAFDDQSSSTVSFESVGGSHVNAFYDNSLATNSFESVGTHSSAFIAYNATLANVIDASTSTISGSLLKGPSSNLTGAGVMLLGTNTIPTINGSASTLQFQSFSATDFVAGGIIGEFNNDANGAGLSFYKSRAATIGGIAAVQPNDVIGNLTFRADDGTNNTVSSRIQANVQNGSTVSSGIVPGTLIFATANSFGALTPALTLDDNQNGYVGSGGATKLFDPSGNLYGNSFVAQGTSPTGTTGSCVASSFVGGAVAGKFSAAVCTAGTFILSALPAAPHGYACDALDQTTPADTLKQSAYTTTSVTFTSTTVASDTVVFKCLAY